MSKIKIIIFQIALFLLPFLSSINLYAAVKVAPIFSNNMVLQREATIPLRGIATTEKKICVHFNGKKYKAKVKNNRWQVLLPPMPAGGNYIIEIKGKNTIRLQNITFGDVWVCAGQSNMDSQISNYKSNYPELFKGHPISYQKKNIRIMKVERVGNSQAQEFIGRDAAFSNGWSIFGPESVATFTVTGYFFGLHLADKIDVPIGLIQSCRGGTPITTWLPKGVLESRVENKPFLDRYQKAVAAWPNLREEYYQKLAAWRKKYNPDDKDWWLQSAETRKMRPFMPDGPEHPNRMNAYYNAMIAPLHQLPVKGVLWYQGEGSVVTAERTKLYEQRLKDLVTSWRKNWNQPDLPFMVVQLPSFKKYTKKPNTTDRRAWTRAAQKNIEDLPNCRTICTIDSGSETDGHPPYKENVGQRLAYAARNMVYGQKDVPRSPEYVSHQSEGTTTIFTFKNYGSGLYVNKPQLEVADYKEGTVLGFIVADEKGIYHRAIGQIIAPNKVKVDHPSINNPLAIRYAWEGFPNSNLFGEGDMPVFPFRTDDLPME